MGMVATSMSSKADKQTEYCRYSVVKVDAEIVRNAKIVALMERTTVQELISDALNEWTAKKLGKPAIKRRPPKPRQTKKATD